MSSCPRWTLRTTSATARTRPSSRAGTSAWGRPGPRPRPWWVQSPATGLRPGGGCNYITRETITSCFSFMTWVSQTGCHTDFILNQWTACWSFTRQKFWRTWTRWADIAGEEFIHTSYIQYAVCSICSVLHDFKLYIGFKGKDDDTSLVWKENLECQFPQQIIIISLFVVMTEPSHVCLMHHANNFDDTQ